MGIKREIFEALATKLQTLPWVSKVEWENIKIGEAEVSDFEIPYIQVYDAGTLYEPERTRYKATTTISVELWLKQTASSTASQGELFDKCEEIEQLIGDDPSLGVTGMLHFRYASDATDLHTIAPYYYAILNFEAIYYKRFTNC